MSTRLSLSTAFVVVMGVLAMISGPVPTRDLAAAMSAELAREMLYSAEMPMFDPILDKNVAILSLSSNPSSMTNSVATLYAQPDPASKVVFMVMPGVEVTVAGYDAEHTFAAITDSMTGTQLYGWMATSQLTADETVMQAMGVTKVYSMSNSDSAMIDELGPYDLVSVVGMSLDSAWYAVSNHEANMAQIGWIESNTVQLLDWQQE
jgi:hypothetical protein